MIVQKLDPREIFPHTDPKNQKSKTPKPTKPVHNFVVRVNQQSEIESQRIHFNQRKKFENSLLGKRKIEVKKSEQNDYLKRISNSFVMKKMKIMLSQNKDIVKENEEKFIREKKIVKEILGGGRNLAGRSDDHNPFVPRNVEVQREQKIWSIEVRLLNPINSSFFTKINKKRKIIDLKSTIQEHLEIYSQYDLKNLKNFSFKSQGKILNFTEKIENALNSKNQPKQVEVEFALNRNFSKEKSRIFDTDKIPKVTKFTISPTRIEMFRM
jgi:hypothetical protein